VTKTYDDDQLHPDGITAADAVPDTHDHTDLDATTRGPGCGVSHYVPGDGFLISHGGFSAKCKTSVYREKVKAIRKARKDTGKRSLPQGGTYLSEEEILNYAAVIQAHRRMTGAKGRKEEQFERARARRHPGTDAEDSAKGGLHSQSDEFDIDRSRSTIRIGLTSIGPPGMPLNGSKVFHRYAVSVSFTNPDGRQLCEAMMSPEQFAAALFGNSHTPCTMSRYWSTAEDQVQLTERVRNPESIRARMEKRLKHRLAEQEKRLRKIAEEMIEQAESGKPARKTQLRDLARAINLSLEHSASNAAFTVDQAREEITSVMESAAIQFLGQRNIDAETLWAAAGTALDMGDAPKQIETKQVETE
jgi:hypothetical protein